MIAITLGVGDGHNKYSAEANVGPADNPFRMRKLNDFWHKAVKRLDPNKLKALMADFKAQDKEEITLKKFKSDGQDKDGVKEAQVRKQLAAILKKYGLSDSDKIDEEVDNNTSGKHRDHYIDKQIFRDKKLDKLWKKAQNSGLNDEQLMILKEEFKHHEMKLKEYKQLIDDMNVSEDKKKSIDEENRDNSLNVILDEEEPQDKDNKEADVVLKVKHFEIKENFRRLSDKVINNAQDLRSSGDEFDEPKAQTLWEMALKSNFNKEELNSLREELEHFETRIRKLKHFESQLDMDSIAGKYINENIDLTGDDSDDKHLKRKVKELTHKVNKLHSELESRIVQRHLEL
ncbi:alpha-2-macroglobulin receptor-associated protein-like isoform X2 [Oppia nitens]|uniref:alpha-2-macroglobulin receptor-associated protein-like isoform X2 n=1 Tax=Oppia nitens TaxID=1686743 RepID=UPI0023DA041F|nr:alpha-2-macroglobulin receptor-associated protein-like isoform X2 [Oppia nitens]